MTQSYELYKVREKIMIRYCLLLLVSLNPAAKKHKPAAARHNAKTVPILVIQKNNALTIISPRLFYMQR